MKVLAMVPHMDDEVPSSTEQSSHYLEDRFIPNFYVDNELYLEKKIEALACY